MSVLLVRQLTLAVNALKKIDKECMCNPAIKRALSDEAAYALRDIKSLGDVEQDLRKFNSTDNITEDDALDIMWTGTGYEPTKQFLVILRGAFRALQNKCYIRRKS